MENLSFTGTAFPLYLATPKTLALLFAGTAIYIGYIDPKVRQSMSIKKQQLRAWGTMFRISKKFMGALGLLASIAGLWAFKKTQNKLFLAGGIAMALLFPYTMITLNKINNELNKINEQVNNMVRFDDQVDNLMNNWVVRHKGRILISLIAAFLFYQGENQVLQKLKDEYISSVTKQ